ncbi:hypothetical protein K32_01710 [Kaistia sp. 32K]|uniref:hypothetical protein n=1 Tax=Kaistia sp. 32K TaxID=2795690 RepID=UPI001915E1A9|nr:hypothetical protein [Kaistia sp. 32K]BCP51554.1 hypothetical protein K32_01710 [Kaistia sp. 32K]
MPDFWMSMAFLGWAIFIVIACDLVGLSLSEFFARRGATMPADVPAADIRSADFAWSVLLGLSALWLCLSAIYAAGYATRAAMLAVPVAAALIAVTSTERRRLRDWLRERRIGWLCTAAALALSLLARPAINPYDDPEYLFFIEKMLNTGAVVEYFSDRRPTNLGSWTLLQALFSAGPAGTAYVASIDSAIAVVLFLFAALLVGTGFVFAFFAALAGVLILQPSQTNLGMAICMGGVSAVLVSLSISRTPHRYILVSAIIPILAATARPQLALIAAAAIGLTVWRERYRRSVLVLCVAAVAAGLWYAIILRDTGGLTSTQSSDYLPVGSVADAVRLMRVGLGDVPFLSRLGLLLLGLVALAAALLRGSRPSAGKYRILAMFFLLAGATSAIVVVKTGARFIELQRYYIPVIDGVLFTAMTFALLSLAQRYGPDRSRRQVLLSISGVVVLGLAVAMQWPRVAAPARSDPLICSWSLQPEARYALDRALDGAGTVVLIDCPSGALPFSNRTMMGDHAAVVGDPAATLRRLRSVGIDRLVFLRNDGGANFGMAELHQWLATFEPLNDVDRRNKEGGQRWLEEIETLRGLSSACATSSIEIGDPQGPLEVVDLAHCE